MKGGAEMKKAIFTIIVIIAVMSVSAAPNRVALVVQNHTSNAPELPMAAFADTLTAQLSGDVFRVVNPQNIIGVTQNRMAQGETMPEMSAQEIGRILNAEGVVTASILEFTKEEIGVPAIAYTLKVRLSLSLADATTGEAVCGINSVEFSKNYTAEKVKADAMTVYESLLHTAAAKTAEKLIEKVKATEWTPVQVKRVMVYFGCNVLGADVQLDGLSYGTCPAQIAVTPGVHTLLVSYPPYYFDYKRKVNFNTDGQTYAVVMQITPDGEKQRRSGELFKKQKSLIDAELSRYKKAGAIEDYVKKTIADGISLYWKNSCSRIIITDGTAERIDFATPKVNAGVLQRGPSSEEIGMKLKELLEFK